MILKFYLGAFKQEEALLGDFSVIINLREGSFEALVAYHMAVQSKWTMSHLLGLKAMESANSIPFIQRRNSGHTKAEPAYAASTWSHSCSSWQMGPTWTGNVDMYNINIYH